MSIIRALQDYLMGFDGMELRTIHTDGTESEAGTCAVAPAGNSKTVEDIIGNRTYLNNYVFYAREYTTSEAEIMIFWMPFLNGWRTIMIMRCTPLSAAIRWRGFLPQMCCCLMWMRTGAAPIRFRYS